MAGLNEIAKLHISVNAPKAPQAEKQLERVAKAGDKVEVSALKSAKATDVLGQSMGSLKTFALGAVAALGAFRILTTARDQAFDFGAAMAEVSTLISGTPEEMELLEKSARSMSVEFGTHAKEQVSGFYQAISAGANGVAGATEILNTANKLAVGGITDVTTGVDILTTVINAYGSDVITAEQASDALFVGMKGGKTTISELAASLGSVIPTANALGISVDVLVAATSALTTQGISTSSATTGLNAALSSIMKPTAEAAKLAKTLGLEFNSTALKTKGLKGFLDDVTMATGGSSDKMSVLFGSMKATETVISMTGGGAEKFTKILEDMENKAGATAAAFEKMAGDPLFRWNQQMAFFRDKILSLGQIIVAILVPALEFLTRNFNTLLGITIAYVTYVGGKLIWTLGVGLVRATIGAIAQTIALGTSMGATGAISAFTAGSIKLVTGALRTLRGAMIATGIGALVVGAGYLIGKFLDLVKATGGVGNALKLMKDVTLEALGRSGLAWDILKLAVKQFCLGMKAAMLESVASLLETIAKAPVAFGGFVVNIVNLALDKIEWLVQKGANGLNALVGAVNKLTGLKLNPISQIDLKQVKNTATELEGLRKTAIGLRDDAKLSIDMAKTLDPTLKAMRTELFAPLEAIKAFNSKLEATNKITKKTTDKTKKLADGLRGFSDGMKSATKESGALAKGLKATSKAQDELRRLAEGWLGKIKTPLQTYKNDIGELNKLLKAGALSQEQFKKATDLVNKELANSNPIINDIAKSWGKFVVGGFKDFKGFATSVLNVFKNMLIKMIAMAAKNKIMIQMGMSGDGSKGGFGVGEFFMSLIGKAKMLGTALMFGAKTTLAGFVTGLSSGIGSAISGGLAAAGSGIISGLGAGTLAGVASAIGAAIPVIAAIGAVVLIAKKLFGRKLKDTGIDGNFGYEEGLQAQNYKFYKGGLFRSNKTKRSKLEKSTYDPLSEAFKNTSDTVVGFAKNLALDMGKLKGFDFKFKVSMKGLNEEQIQKKFTELLSDMGNKMADSFTGISKFAQGGETALQTLQRLSVSLTVVNDVFGVLGFSLKNASLAGGDAASSFAKLFGGLESFKSVSSKYYSEFYTKSERVKKATDTLQKELAKLGITKAPKTRVGYRDLISKAMSSGKYKLAAKLMKLSGAFAALTKSTDSLKADKIAALASITLQRKSLEKELLELTGNTVGLRALELKSIDKSNHALKKRIWALQDEKKASDKAKSLFNNEISNAKFKTRVDADFAKSGFDYRKKMIDITKQNGEQMKKMINDLISEIKSGNRALIINTSKTVAAIKRNSEASA